jgi:putative transposase
MPRRVRSLQGGLLPHVLNRASGRQPACGQEADYEAFQRVIEEASARAPLWLVGYCAMSNHWRGSGGRKRMGRCPSSTGGWP